MSLTLQKIKDYLLDPLPIAVACGNWLAIAYSIWGEGYGRPFHWYYESVFTQILGLLNFPSMVVGGIVVGPIVSVILGVSHDRNDFVVFAVTLLITGLQWFLITKFIQFLYRGGPVSP